MVYGVQPVREALRGRRRVREVVLHRARGRARLARRGRRERHALEIVPDGRGHGARRAPRPPGRGRAHRALPVRRRVRAALGRRIRSSWCSTASPTRATSARSSGPARAPARDGLVVPRHGSAGVTSIVAKASAGAVEHVRIAMATNLAELLRRTKRPDLWSYAAEAEGGAGAVGDRHDVRARCSCSGSEGSGHPPARAGAVRRGGDDPAGGPDRVAERRRGGRDAAVRGRAPARGRRRASCTLSIESASRAHGHPSLEGLRAANACSICRRISAFLLLFGQIALSSRLT